MTREEHRDTRPPGGVEHGRTVAMTAAARVAGLLGKLLLSLEHQRPYPPPRTPRRDAG